MAPNRDSAWAAGIEQLFKAEEKLSVLQYNLIEDATQLRLEGLHATVPSANIYEYAAKLQSIAERLQDIRIQGSIARTLLNNE